MGRGTSKVIARQVLANHIADMRPTVDAVHDAVVQATHHGLTYVSIANALQSTEARVQRWAAGVDIPAPFSERRAILSTISRLLHEMNGTTPTVTPQDWRRPSRTPEGRERRTEMVKASVESLREHGVLLCMHCMRNRNKGDVVCTSRNCRNKVKA
jgi:hypothetical protein